MTWPLTSDLPEEEDQVEIKCWGPVLILPYYLVCLNTFMSKNTRMSCCNPVAFCSIQTNTLFLPTIPCAATNVGTRGWKIKAQCYNKVLCPHYMHGACNSTHFVKAAWIFNRGGVIGSRRRRQRCVKISINYTHAMFSPKSNVYIRLIYTHSHFMNFPLQFQTLWDVLKALRNVRVWRTGWWILLAVIPSALQVSVDLFSI